METSVLNPRMRLVQQASMQGKVVLVRVDHNVVKKGKIEDPYRIDVTSKTLYSIAEKGGRPILMTHVGRPRDKKTGHIECKEMESVLPIIQYLEARLPIKIALPRFPIDPQWGITQLDDSIMDAIQDLRKGKWGMIYLPNIRWFRGEEASGPERERFVKWLAGLADVYINDAFSSWQAHGSTYDIAKHLPSYAGFQLQEELLNMHKVLEPQRPFVAVIAGSKYDTKIAPLKDLHKRADHLILGGVMYNVYVSAKYQVHISGVSEEERNGAKELVELEERANKIIEIPRLIESDFPKEKKEGQYRTIHTGDMKKGDTFHYILDMDPQSLQDEKVRGIIRSAKTIFVNAVMGLTPPFFEGTQSLYRLIASNKEAIKLFAGGDTLQELRNLCPDIYLKGMDAPDYYYFTGGGSVLTTLEKGSPYQLKAIEALMDG